MTHCPWEKKKQNKTKQQQQKHKKNPQTKHTPPPQPKSFPFHPKFIQRFEAPGLSTPLPRDSSFAFTEAIFLKA